MTRLSSDLEEATSLRSLYTSRSALLEKSDGRRSLLREIAESNLLRSTRSIVFHERIEEARKTAALLERCGHRTSIELSTDDQRRRVEAIRDFKSGAAQILVAVKTLDEGIDLPDAKLAVIAAGSSSPRQRLQRIGRVIRPTGAPALVISLTAKGTNEEFIVAANDGILVGSKRVKLLSSLQDGLEQWNR
jgi:superfamily II DNA or RNA helicase